MFNTLNEYLASLPDEMLLNIDPRDNASLEKGSKFIKEFNNNMFQYKIYSERISKQIKEYFSIDLDKISSGENKSANREFHKEIQKLSEEEAHSLNEDFTYKKPDKISISGKIYSGLRTWKKMYIEVLRELMKSDPQRFEKLLREKKFISKRGKPYFSMNEKKLRSPEEIGSGIFVEANLSANNIRDNIRAILEYFGINVREIKIYFAED